MPEIKIIGAGLAGSEAALCLAEMGISVNLLEMRPLRMTPAHGTDLAAELVCSNSLKSDLLDTASGLLKEELRLLGSRLLPIARSCAVPAGHALAVDRLLFAQKVTQTLQNHPRIRITRQEVTELPAKCSILCAGPLVSDSLARSLQEVVGESQLSFFDAIAPIVSAESIDSAKVYAKDRYDKGEPGNTTALSMPCWRANSIRRGSLKTSSSARWISTTMRTARRSKSWPGAAGRPCATA